MSDNPVDPIVSGIIDDFTTSLSVTSKEDLCHRLFRAVQAIRIHAVRDTVITEHQRADIDAAIIAAQPMMVGGPVHNDQRVMVAALHVVTAEWARSTKTIGSDPTVLEAFLLTRILDNWLCTCLLTESMRLKRAAMTADQLRSLSDLMDDIYPVAGATAETMPLTVTTVH